MTSRSKDIVHQMEMTSELEELNHIDLSKERFMPYLEMKSLKSVTADKDFDIYQVNEQGKKVIDVAKLSNYVEPMMHFRLRKKQQGVDLNWYRTMRSCTPSDFIEKGYEKVK